MATNFKTSFSATGLAIICLLALCAAAESQTTASFDPILVDPQHFKLEYEDAHIRVLRFRLSPGEKSPMHDHAARSVVSLTNTKVRLTFDDGAVQEVVSVAGSAIHLPAMRYAVENIGKEVYEAVSTEFKDQGYAAKARPPDSTKDQTLYCPVVETPEPDTVAAIPSRSTIPLKESVATTAPANQVPVENPKVPGQTQATPATSTLQRETPEGVVKTVTVNGAELAYIDRGQGPHIIFLHDELGDYRSWLHAKSFDALTQNFRVLSYSRRYHYPNYSSGKERDYTFSQNAKDLADFIRALNLGAVNLVGVGYGSSLAAMVAAKNPELVRSLALADPEFVDLLPPTRAEAARSTRDEIYHVIRKPLNKGQTDIALQTYVDWGRGSGMWEHYNAETRSQQKQNANALKAQTYDAPSPALTCADLHSIKAPVLLIVGEVAPPNARDIASAITMCIGKVEQLLVPNLDYADYRVDPEKLNKFLSK